MNESDFINLLADVVFALPFLGALGCIFLWRVYLSDGTRPRSWVLLRLAVVATVSELVSIVGASLALLRFAGISLAGLGAVILALIIIVLELLPIWLAYSVYRERSKQMRNQNG